VSIAVTRPGAAAPTCVNIASDTSKWLFECDPHVRPQSRHGLRDAHRAGHRPEVRVGKRNVDRLQRERVDELAPVGRDHVGRVGSRCAAELGHHFSPGEALLRAAWVFGVGDDVAQSRIKRTASSAASRRSGRA
jgi:hypothetical protein